MAVSSATQAYGICKWAIDSDTSSVVASVSADANKRFEVRKIVGSYAGQGANAETATLAFTLNGSSTSLVFNIPPSSTNPLVVSFGPGEVVGDKNTAITLTMSDPAAGNCTALIGYVEYSEPAE